MFIVAVSASSAAQETAPAPLSLDKFIMLTGDQAEAIQLLECPNHKFGTLEDGVNEIKKRLGQLLPGRVPFVQFCHDDQIQTVNKCAPLVPLASINPFAHPGERPPSPPTLIWPRFDHPLINSVREIKEAAGNTRLLARIDFPASEIAYFREKRIRRLSFEEISWLCCAAIGADFKGFVWLKSGISSYEETRLRRFETNLAKHADDLGTASLVRWARGPKGQPISSLWSNKTLFVILLNPVYFAHLEKDKPVPLPLGDTQQEGEIEIQAPQGVSVVDGTTLSGIPLKLDKEESRTRTKYRFNGGGEILVFQLSGHPAGVPESRVMPNTSRPAKEVNP
jgi:hypothetical protein